MKLLPSNLRSALCLGTLAVGLLSTAAAQTYSVSLEGPIPGFFNPTNQFQAEFPFFNLTTWSATLVWTGGAAPLCTPTATQAQFDMDEFTVTLHGLNGDLTTAALNPLLNVTNNAAGTRHSLQFTSGGWGPSTLVTGTLLDQTLYSLNIELGGNSGNGAASLAAAPGSIDLDLYNLTTTAQSSLKIYLNDFGSMTLTAPIGGYATSPVPEPSTYASVAGLGVLALGFVRRRAVRSLDRSEPGPTRG